MYRHFLSFLAITIDQSRPKFHCVKQLYTPQLSVLFTVHTILVTIRISIADLIGWTRGVSSGVPLRLGTFGCDKNCTDIYCEKYAKIWKLLKMYAWNVPFQISKYATGWGAATPMFAPGGKYPRAATESSQCVAVLQLSLQVHYSAYYNIRQQSLTRPK